MRRTAIVLAVLATAAGLTVGGADAASKVSCKIMTDPAGDVAVQTPAPLPGDDSDDLLWADMASNAKSITVVLQLKALAYPDPQWVFGRAYNVNFTLKGSSADEIFLAARTFPQGVQYHLGHRETLPPLGSSSNIYDLAVTGSIDTAKGQIRITAPMAALAKLGKATKGTVIKSASATVERLAGQGVVASQTVNGNRIPLGGFRYQADISDGSKPYTLGAPSCTKVG
ncbi:MAG: hypothetical protein QOK42_300 [Frankiaceae bacterium]|jgi:hypothetical protein|nr:hypothetical protein [Frankiaceae bacterium]